MTEMAESLQWSEEEIEYYSPDVASHLSYDSSGLKEDLAGYYFKQNDDLINPTEQFVLDWIEEVWVQKQGNPELSEKIMMDLRGYPQEFDFYAKELSQSDNANILRFEALVSEIQQVDPSYDDKFEILGSLLYHPEQLLHQCESYYFLADGGGVDPNEQQFLHWIQTEWVEKNKNSQLADEIALHLAHKKMENAAASFRNYSRY